MKNTAKLLIAIFFIANVFSAASCSETTADENKTKNNTEAMNLDTNPPFELDANGDIVCDECNPDFMSKFNDEVPDFAKKDLVELQTKLAAQEGIDNTQLDSYMTDAMLQQANTFDVDLERGLGENETATVNGEGNLVITNPDMGDRVISKGQFSVDSEGNYRISGTGGKFANDYTNSNNTEYKNFMTAYQEDGSDPTKSIYGQTEVNQGSEVVDNTEAVVKTTTTADPYANFDYTQLGLTEKDWNSASPEEKEALAGSVGFDVNEYANNSELIKNQEAELKNQEAELKNQEAGLNKKVAERDSLQKVLDQKRGK